MRDFVADGGLGNLQRGDGFADTRLMSNVGKESSFGLGPGVSNDVVENFAS